MGGGQPYDTNATWRYEVAAAKERGADDEEIRQIVERHEFAEIVENF